MKQQGIGFSVRRLVWMSGLAVLLMSVPLWGETPPAYDPLFIAPGASGTVVDRTVVDQNRNREVPIRIYLNESASPAPVVLFSHGLGGSRAGCAYLGKHWANRGYVAVVIQHPGSDESVWKDQPLMGRVGAMQQAASAKNLLLRVGDVTAVLDQLEIWNRPGDEILAGRLDLGKIGMSGHSFGAHTTQAVSGQSFFGGSRLTDPRIKAAIMFSPSAPKRGDPKNAFGQVSIPWMLMTGTKDVAAIGGATLEMRQNVFPYLPPGEKYELVLFGAEHSAFADQERKGVASRNPNHHRVILALSTAFWDAFLKGDGAARAWLDGNGPASVLEAEDRWQRK